MTSPRFTIVLCNGGGELDRRTAETPEEARNMVVEIAAGLNDFHGGDSIRVIEEDVEEDVEALAEEWAGREQREYECE